jgi:hypothetical protein
MKRKVGKTRFNEFACKNENTKLSLAMVELRAEAG